MAFRKAVRSSSKARVALYGPAGVGKSKWALVIAYALGERVAVIDSERGSASKWSGEIDSETGVTFDFDVCELDSHAPQQYTKEIRAAEQAGYDVLVIDSLTHAWSGRDGALEQVDNHARRSNSGNTHFAWREVTPAHNELVDAILSSKLHVIVTLRAKTAYVVDEVTKNGRTVNVPRKVGLAPVQREGLEFEFDVVGALDQDHVLSVTKSRCPALDGATIDGQPGHFANVYRTWLAQGSAAPVPSAPRMEYDPGSEPGAERERERAEQQQRSERRPRERQSRHLRPPARVRDSDAPVPRFSPQAKWSGAAKWSGRPLREADAGALLEYAKYVQLEAVANDGTPKGEVQRRHLAAVEEAIIAVTPALDVSEGDPWGLAGEPSCEPCPANPECPRYQKCLAAEAQSEREREASGA